MRRKVLKPDWFSYHYACWANNHRGWQKMKKKERRMVKRRLKRELRKEIKEEVEG